MTPRERIEKLLGMAREAGPERQRRYVELARRISERTRTPIPRELKRRICKGCGVLLVPGRTATVRAEKGRKTLKCTECGEVRVLPYKPGKNEPDNAKDKKTY